MTTETKESPELIARVVPIKDIKVKEQHRRHFDEKRIKELSLNIGRVGILQPLLIRTMGTDKPYELVAGERRLRAAKLAGLEEVPARIGSWTDQEAAEIQALENLHRQDLTAIEEGRAFKALQDTGNYDTAALAARVGKSPSYVHRAIALIELPSKIQDLIEERQLTPTHGHILLRAPKEHREKLASQVVARIKQSGEAPTASQFWDDVERAVGRDLTKAIFPKDKPFAGKVACAGCPFNSEHQSDLFDGVTKGRCTNPGCYDAKTAQGVGDLKKNAETEYEKLGLKFAGEFQEEDQIVGYYSGKFKNGTILQPALLRTQKVKDAMTKTPDAFAWAFIRPRYAHQGQPRAVVFAKAKADAKAATGTVTGMTLAQKKERATLIRNNFIQRHVNEALTAAAMKTCDAGFTKEHLAAVVSRTPHMNNGTREGIQAHVQIPTDLHDVKKLMKIDEKVLRRVAFGAAFWGWQEPDEDMLVLVGVNVKKITAEASKKAGDLYDSKKKKKVDEAGKNKG